MHKMSKQLYEHERLLTEIKESKLSSSTVSGSMSEHSGSGGLLALEANRMLRQELDMESQKIQSKIAAVAEELRRESSERYTRKEEFAMMIFNEIQELKSKLQSESRTAFESLWRDVEELKLRNF